MAGMVPTVVMNSERAKAALSDVLATLSLPENIVRLAEAKSAAGSDMLLYMQLVFPLATQIQQEVIQNYGFPADREGLLQFTRAIKLMGRENQEILQLSEDLRQLLLPPMKLPFSQASTV